MKKTKTKILILLTIIILLSSGCTKIVKDGKKNIVYEETGQTLTENILCKPTDESLLELYETHKDKMDTKIEELPDCDTFKITSQKYTGIWEQFFVKPLAWVILNIGKLVGNMGLAVMLIGLLIRVLMMPISKKSAMQTEVMKKIQPEMDKIEKKYESLLANAPAEKQSELTMAKSQETMMVYKKYGVNPVSGCLVAVIQLPLFFAFLEAVNRVPAIFEDSMLGLRLGMTPFKGLTDGNYIYILLLICIIASTYFSMKGSMNQASGDAAKQMAFMSKFMMIFIAIASLSLPTAIALYWIVTNGFQVIQTQIIKKTMKKDNKKQVKSAKISKKRGK